MEETEELSTKNEQLRESHNLLTSIFLILCRPAKLKSKLADDGNKTNLKFRKLLSDEVLLQKFSAYFLS